MFAVGIRQEGVFTVDDHGADPVAAQFERPHLGHAVLEINLSPPCFLELLLIGGVGDRLEAGVVVGKRAPVAGTLNVVLASHRVDAGSLATDVSGHQGQVTQALHVIDAADVLGDAERVVNRALICLPIYASGSFYVGGGNLRYGLSPFRGEVLDVFEKRFAVGRAAGDELRMGQTVALNDVRHRQQEGCVRSDSDR